MSRNVKKQTISHSNNAEVRLFQIKSAKVVKSLCDAIFQLVHAPKQSFGWDVSNRMNRKAKHFYLYSQNKGTYLLQTAKIARISKVLIYLFVKL